MQPKLQSNSAPPFSSSTSFKGELKRDKLKGTNGPQFAVFPADSRRFLQIFAFPVNYRISEAQIFAGNRRFSQKTAGNRRLSQKPVCPI